MASKIEKMSFEEAFTALAETLEQLESGDLPLVESLGLYERGMALVKHCGLELDTAELRIKQLNPSGNLTPFEAE